MFPKGREFNFGQTGLHEEHQREILLHTSKMLAYKMGIKSLRKGYPLHGVMPHISKEGFLNSMMRPLRLLVFYSNESSDPLIL